VIKTFSWQNHPCRQIRVSSEAGDRKGSNVLSLCQVEGKWKVLSASELKKG
jgi:hypothetical protein